MIPLLEVFANPANANALLADFIMRLDCDQRRQMLWQFADRDKPDRLEEAVANSPLACFAVNGKGHCHAIAWLAPFEYGSLTCACHFAFAGPTTRQQRLAAGQDFLKRAFQEVDLLLALMPVPWRGARNYAMSLGFAPLLLMPKVCWLEERQRRVDGLFMVLHGNKPRPAAIITR